MGEVTSLRVSYPEKESPNWLVPTTYAPYRYGMARIGTDMLVAIGMNPSAAREDSSDRTVNRIIKASQTMGYDGWAVFNIYPERATDAKTLSTYDPVLIENNIATIQQFLLTYHITEVWGAWGDLKYKALQVGKQAMLDALKMQQTKIFHFSELTKSGNPRHPLYLKILPENKRYL